MTADTSVLILEWPPTQRLLGPHPSYLYDTCFRRCIWQNRSSIRGPADTVRAPSGQGWKTSASSPRRQRLLTTSSSAARPLAALSARGPPPPGPSAILLRSKSVPPRLGGDPTKVQGTGAPGGERGKEALGSSRPSRRSAQTTGSRSYGAQCLGKADRDAPEPWGNYVLGRDGMLRGVLLPGRTPDGQSLRMSQAGALWLSPQPLGTGVSP